MTPRNGTGKNGQAKKPGKPAPKSVRRKRKRGPNGRPTKLTLELMRKVCDSIRGGVYVETAASMAGICKKSLYEWMRKGAREGKGLTAKFLHAMEKAIAENETNTLQRIGDAGKGTVMTTTKTTKRPDGTVETSVEQKEVRHWQADAWFLERRHPTRWGRRIYVEDDSEDTESIRQDAEQEVTRMAGIATPPDPAGIAEHEGKVRGSAGGAGKRKKRDSET